MSLLPQAQVARALNAAAGTTFVSGMMHASGTQYAVYAWRVHGGRIAHRRTYLIVM